MNVNYVYSLHYCLLLSFLKFFCQIWDTTIKFKKFFFFFFSLTDTLNNENQEHYTTCIQHGNGLSLTLHSDEICPKILFSFPSSLLRSTVPAYPICFYRFNNSSSKWYVKKKISNSEGSKQVTDRSHSRCR